MIPNDQTEVLDNEILKILRNFKPSYGMQSPAICSFLVLSGFSLTPDDLAPRLDYLADKKMIEETTRVLHQANRSWRIAKDGRDYLDRQNL